MDAKYIFNCITDKDYDSLINHIYDDLNKLTNNLEQRHDYSHRVKRGNIYELGKFLETVTIHDPLWYEILREIVIYLARIYAKLRIDNFNVIQVDNDQKIKLMILYILFYHYDARSISTKKLFTGTDFEFNERKISLCQIGFYPHRTNKFVWVFDPNSLNTHNTNFLIKYYFTSQFLQRILHGSDSLDIPYLFQEMFMNNHEYIYSFITNVIDTRFLCEYHKNTISGDRKCSIYDALLYFNTIDKVKYNELQHINKTMGPIQDVNWNVYNMSTFNLKYSVYDVLYLRDFYFDILKKSWLETPELYNSYVYIPLITRFIYLEKWNVSDLLSRIKSIVDPINNYIVVPKNNDSSIKQNITMISVYNGIIKDLIIETPVLKIKINNLLDINYFRSSLTLLFKMIVYHILTNNYSVFKNKEETFDGKVDVSDIFETFKLISMKKLRTLVKLFLRQAEIDVGEYLKEIS